MPSNPMKRPVGLAAAGLIALSAAAGAETPPAKAGGAEAAAACERAARQSLNSQSAQAVEVSFNAPPAADPTLSNEAQVVLRGAGRSRAGGSSVARSFSYSCTVDLRNAEAVGLVLRDTTPAGTLPPVERALPEPDLSHVSPAACESDVAAALTRRWPGVSQISFEAATRRLVQQSATRAELQGQGRATPAPGQPASLFRFDCEIDPRDGRVLATRIAG